LLVLSGLASPWNLQLPGVREQIVHGLFTQIAGVQPPALSVVEWSDVKSWIGNGILDALQ
jgi:hypothetical protein